MHASTAAGHQGVEGDLIILWLRAQLPSNALLVFCRFSHRLGSRESKMFFAPASKHRPKALAV